MKSLNYTEVLFFTFEKSFFFVETESEYIPTTSSNLIRVPLSLIPDILKLANLSVWDDISSIGHAFCLCFLLLLFFGIFDPNKRCYHYLELFQTLGSEISPENLEGSLESWRSNPNKVYARKVPTLCIISLVLQCYLNLHFSYNQW